LVDLHHREGVLREEGGSSHLGRNLEDLLDREASVVFGEAADSILRTLVVVDSMVRRSLVEVACDDRDSYRHSLFAV
jgi:hypothetical protein